MIHKHPLTSLTVVGGISCGQSMRIDQLAVKSSTRLNLPAVVSNHASGRQRRSVPPSTTIDLLLNRWLQGKYMRRQCPSTPSMLLRCVSLSRCTRTTPFTANKKRGTTTQTKQYVEQLVEYSNDQSNKKRSKADYNSLDLDVFVQEAKTIELDNDVRYRNGPHLKNLSNASRLMTQTYWNKIKVTDGLYEDVKRVFPVFWKLYSKELGDKPPRKGAMLSTQRNVQNESHGIL